MTRVKQILLFGLGASLMSAAVAAQPPPEAATPCAEKPPVVCPYGFSGSSWTSINLKMQPEGGKTVCKFDLARMDPPPGPSLQLAVGQSATYDVCNSCDVDVKVQFDTWSGPWHTNFQSTSPIASADGTVTLQSVPCRGYGTVSGFSALSGGSFKSTVRVALVGGAFHDDMDPELEIEDNHPFKHLYKWVLALAAMLGVGWWLGRRRRT